MYIRACFVACLAKQFAEIFTFPTCTDYFVNNSEIHDVLENQVATYTL